MLAELAQQFSFDPTRIRKPCLMASSVTLADIPSCFLRGSTINGHKTDASTAPCPYNHVRFQFLIAICLYIFLSVG